MVGPLAGSLLEMAEIDVSPPPAGHAGSVAVLTSCEAFQRHAWDVDAAASHDRQVPYPRHRTAADAMRSGPEPATVAGAPLSGVRAVKQLHSLLAGSPAPAVDVAALAAARLDRAGPPGRSFRWTAVLVTDGGRDPLLAWLATSLGYQAPAWDAKGGPERREMRVLAARSSPASGLLHASLNVLDRDHAALAVLVRHRAWSGPAATVTSV